MSMRNDKQQRGNIIVVFVSLLGMVVAFINIYHAANRHQPGNAIGSAVALASFSALLTTYLARMRKD